MKWSVLNGNRALCCSTFSKLKCFVPFFISVTMPKSLFLCSVWEDPRLHEPRQCVCATARATCSERCIDKLSSYWTKLSKSSELLPEIGYSLARWHTFQLWRGIRTGCIWPLGSLLCATTGTLRGPMQKTTAWLISGRGRECSFALFWWC